MNKRSHTWHEWAAADLGDRKVLTGPAALLNTASTSISSHGIKTCLIWSSALRSGFTIYGRIDIQRAVHRQFRSIVFPAARNASSREVDRLDDKPGLGRLGQYVTARQLHVPVRKIGRHAVDESAPGSGSFLVVCSKGSMSGVGRQETSPSRVINTGKTGQPEPAPTINSPGTRSNADPQRAGLSSGQSGHRGWRDRCRRCIRQRHHSFYCRSAARFRAELSPGTLGRDPIGDTVAESSRRRRRCHRVDRLVPGALGDRDAVSCDQERLPC
jgi:hypothetical protein